MKLRSILTLAAGLGVALTVSAQRKKTCYVPKAGTLAELVKESEAAEITHLTLQGRLNATDFRYLRDGFGKLKVLDISHAAIGMYAGMNGTLPGRFCIYPANSIPAFAFCRQDDGRSFVGKDSLTRVILSDKTKNIENAAFKACPLLKVCQIRRKTPPTLLKEALADSTAAIFVPPGCGDAYRAKEEWRTFAIVEGEPLAVRVQVGTMGSLASELVRKGIRPQEVNFLAVEGKLDEADFTLVRDYMPNLVSADLTQCNATTIPDYTFTQKKYLLRIRLPHGLQTIGQRAFSGCIRLSGTLELPPGVKAIEFGAFMDCNSLRQVVATGNSITTLGDKLFGEAPSKLVYRK